MGGIFTEKLNIESDINIFKISQNVFSYGKLNFDENYILKICFLLDKGSKFVPNNIENIFDFYDKMYKKIDNSLVQFNKLIFLEKIKSKNKNNNSPDFDNNFDVNIHNNSSDYDNSVSLQTITKFGFSNPFNKINKRIINYQNIPIQKETIKFRENILSDCNKIASKLKSDKINKLNNLNETDIKILFYFCSRQPFRILKCVKNVGSILISNEN